MTDPKLEALVEAGQAVVDWRYDTSDERTDQAIEDLRFALAAIEPSPEPSPEPSAEEVAKEIWSEMLTRDRTAAICDGIQDVRDTAQALLAFRAAGVREAQTALARIAKVSCFVDMADSDADQAKDALHGIGVLQRIARTALSPGGSDDE